MNPVLNEEDLYVVGPAPRTFVLSHTDTVHTNSLVYILMDLLTLKPAEGLPIRPVCPLLATFAP